MQTVPMLPDEHREPLSPTLQLIVSPQHRFNTDTILLAWFSSPKHKDTCCDFGTGCGTIPLLWESRFQPKQTYALEIQDNAFSMASRSVLLNGLTDRITILQGDIKQVPQRSEPVFQEGFDVIACNPPYKELGTGFVNPDSSKAIARHEQECTMEDICKSAYKALRYGGRFCICQRPQRLAEIMMLLSQNGLEPTRLRLVQQRPDKAPSLFLLESKKGGRSGLTVEPTLFIEGADGDFSGEMKEAYGTYKYKD